MALKFRRGTTAQKSGSLAYGEPYVNTTLGTLQIGGATGDITLAGASATVGISGSSLDITGNAKIDGNLSLGGNITIGDNTSDVVNVTAALSSSLIPQTTNAFDLGSASKIWRDLYISTGSIKFVEGTSVVKTLTANTLNALEAATGSSNIALTNLNSKTGSYATTGSNIFVNDQTITGSLAINDSATNFLIEGNPFSQTYLTSNGAIVLNPGYGGVEMVGSNRTFKATDITAEGFVSGEVKANNGVVSGSSQVVGILSSLNSYTSSLNNAIQLTGSTVSFLGNIVVYGSQSVINSQNVSISDNIIYLSPTSSVDNDLGIVGHYNDGTYRHAGIFMDASDGHSWKVFNGLTTETSAQIDTSGTGFTLADFKAGAFTGTSFTGIHNGTINATNGVISGSSQLTTDFDTRYLNTGGDGVVSGSSQISLGSASGNIALSTQTTGDYVASLVAGTNITLSNNSGEGATPTIGLTNNTISGISLGSNLATLTIGTGLSGTSYNGSTGVTIANTGVTSNVAGTGVTVSGATGAVTISIGQSVATSASPTFAGLSINGAITATGDITAYYTSDKRHKNNIQTITNAVLKVKQLNGVTWEWNDDVHEVTKSTPKTGLIAQEVQQVLPQVVTERADGFLALDYSKMMGLLVEAIKEQQIQIDQLKAQIGSK